MSKGSSVDLDGARVALEKAGWKFQDSDCVVNVVSYAGHDWECGKVSCTRLADGCGELYEMYKFY